MNCTFLFLFLALFTNKSVRNLYILDLCKFDFCFWLKNKTRLHLCTVCILYICIKFPKLSISKNSPAYLSIEGCLEFTWNILHSILHWYSCSQYMQQQLCVTWLWRKSSEIMFANSSSDTALRGWLLTPESTYCSRQQCCRHSASSAQTFQLISTWLRGGKIQQNIIMGWIVERWIYC